MSMSELKKKISALIYNYFDNKVANFNFYGATEKDKVAEEVEDLQEEIDDLISETEWHVDSIIENFDSTQARKEYLQNLMIDRREEDERI